MPSRRFDHILAGLRSGQVIPYLGPQVLDDVTDAGTGAPIPAADEPLIHAMTEGRSLSPKLMTEFPRAAMHFELKKGRRFLSSFLTRVYSSPWSGGAVHEWLSSLDLPYVVDTNRDAVLQHRYANRRHTLVTGVARIMASDYRFRIWEFDGEVYREIGPGDANPDLPILFKPLGTPFPEPTYIASDADYVDYITELMGGFAVPSFVKNWRQGKQYLIAGVRLKRDTQRMILSDIVIDADTPAGWALIPDPTPKERRYCRSKHIEILECTTNDLLHAARTRTTWQHAEAVLAG